jgi:hypothetical protein
MARRMGANGVDKADRERWLAQGGVEVDRVVAGVRIYRFVLDARPPGADPRMKGQGRSEKRLNQRCLSRNSPLGCPCHAGKSFIIRLASSGAALFWSLSK